MLFGSSHAKVVRSKPTGVSDRDIINIGTGLYNGVEMGYATDDSARPFKYKEAWNILRCHPKIINIYDKSCSNDRGRNSAVDKQKDSKLSDNSRKDKEADEVVGKTSIEDKKTPRSVGRKRAKEQAQKEAESKKKIGLTAESVAA